MTTKPGFQCIAIHDMARAEGIVSPNAIYPVFEAISDDYQIVITEDGRGFPIVPGNGRFVNAGEPFVEFRRVDIPVEDEITAPDEVSEDE